MNESYMSNFLYLNKKIREEGKEAIWETDDGSEFFSVAKEREYEEICFANGSQKGLSSWRRSLKYIFSAQALMSATDVTLIFKLYDITTFAVDIDDVNVPILASLPFVKSFTFCVKKLRCTFFGWKYTTNMSKLKS